MKRTLLAVPILIAGLAIPQFVLAAPLGPPAANVPAGKFSLGVEADLGDRKVKQGDAALNFNINPAPPSPFSGSEKQTFSGSEYKIKHTAYNLVPSYGVTNNITLFGRLGQSKFKDKDDSDSINTAAEKSYGVGARGTFYENNTVRIGMMAQYTTYPTRKAMDNSSTTIPKYNGTTLYGYKMDSGTFLGFYDGATMNIKDIKMKATEMEASLGASFKFGAATPYIGIDYSKFTATYSADAMLAVNTYQGQQWLVLKKDNTTMITWGRTATASLDAPKDKEKTPLGAYAGIDYSLTPHLKLIAELRLINQTSYSLALNYMF